MFRRHVAHQARQHRRRVGTSAHCVRPVPENAFNLLYILFLDEIADALGRDGKAAEGLSTIDEALARSARNDERWCVAELLRIKGELILRKGAPQAATAAEEHFCGRSTGRAAGCAVMGAANVHKLARLQQDQGRITEARSLLQSVYDRSARALKPPT